MNDLTQQWCELRGVPIATLADLQELAYEVPEGENPPQFLSALISGQDPDPIALFNSLCEFESRTQSDSELLRERINQLKGRLRRKFAGLSEDG